MQDTLYSPSYPPHILSTHTHTYTRIYIYIWKVKTSLSVTLFLNTYASVYFHTNGDTHISIYYVWYLIFLPFSSPCNYLFLLFCVGPVVCIVNSWRIRSQEFSVGFLSFCFFFFLLLQSVFSTVNINGLFICFQFFFLRFSFCVSFLVCLISNDGEQKTKTKQNKNKTKNKKQKQNIGIK